MNATDHRSDAQPGDWLEARGIHGQPARRGEIVEVLGHSGHKHFRVRWDEEHESIVFPADGVSVIRHPHPRR
jgi:hypothetical protein